MGLALGPLTAHVTIPEMPRTEESVRGPLLVLRHASKSFGGPRVLDDVSLEVEAGEIHGLVGQNGSGKSTLIKILCGYHAPDPGAELIVNGAPIRLPMSPGEFRALGFSFVHQNLGLASDLSVLDNIRVGRYRARDLGRINWRDERRLTEDALLRFGAAVEPWRVVGDLPEATRALIAIARAVQGIEEHAGALGHRGVLILDEPTPYLSESAVEALFAAMRQVAGAGTACLFVSHRLDEVHQITDRVTVLRDGRMVVTAKSRQLSDDDLINFIVGRRLTTEERSIRSPGREAALSVRALSGSRVRDLSFQVGRGEILGLTGLLGMGFEDVPYLLVGADKAQHGTAIIGGSTVPLPDMNPARALELNVGLVPAFRERDGAVMTLTVRENITLPRVRRYFRRFKMDYAAERREARAIASRFDVRPDDTERLLSTLSGGNQQKAIVGKWLSMKPDVLLLHEPTQGVDVGARREILGQVREAADRGAAIVVSSIEYEELAGLCNRVLVMQEGRVTAELTGPQLTKELILDRAYRSHAAAIRAG